MALKRANDAQRSLGHEPQRQVLDLNASCHVSLPLNEVWGMNPRDSLRVPIVDIHPLVRSTEVWGMNPRDSRPLACASIPVANAQRSLGHEPQRQNVGGVRFAFRQRRSTKSGA